MTTDGEGGVSMKIGHIGMSFLALDFSIAGGSFSIQGAQSIYESSFGISVSSISIGSVSRQTVPFVAWILETESIDLRTKDDISTYNGNLFEFRALEVHSGGEATEQLVHLPINMTLRNRIITEYSDIPLNPNISYFITSHCDGVKGMLNLTCPDSAYHFQVSCNGTVGTVISECPKKMLKEEPRCVVVNNVEKHLYSPDECSLISHDSMTTVCTCSVRVNQVSADNSRSIIDDGHSSAAFTFGVATTVDVVAKSGSNISFTPFHTNIEYHTGKSVYAVSLVLILTFVLCLVISCCVEDKLQSIATNHEHDISTRGTEEKQKKIEKLNSSRRSKAWLHWFSKVVGISAYRISVIFCKPKKKRITRKKSFFGKIWQKILSGTNFAFSSLVLVISKCGIFLYIKCKRCVGNVSNTCVFWLPNNIVTSIRLDNAPLSPNSTKLTDCIGDVNITGDFIESSLPTFFYSSETPHVFALIWIEFYKHYKWGHLLKLLASPFDISYVIGLNLLHDTVCLFSDILSAMTLLTLAYVWIDSNGEDGNSCQGYNDKERCLDPGIGVGVGHFLGDVCEWDDSLKCSFRSPSSSIWSIVVVTCLVSIVAVPINGVIRFLFTNYAFAPTLKQSSWNGFSSLFPLWMVEEMVCCLKDSSFSSTFKWLKSRKVDAILLSVLKNSKSDAQLLRSKVVEHAELLTGHEKYSFLLSWGIDVNTPFDRDRKIRKSDKRIVGVPDDHNEGCFEFINNIFSQPSCDDVLLRRLCRVHLSTIQERNFIMSNIQCCREPLNESRVVRMLFNDLLPDHISRIFKYKCNSAETGVECRNITPKAQLTRVVAISAILVYVWFSVFVIYYFGASRDYLSQQLWCLSLLTWCLLDMLFLQWFGTFCLHLLLPGLIVPRVKGIQSLLIRCICQLEDFNLKDNKFTWSSLLFSSARVVSKYYSSRFSELIMAICLNVPLRSTKNFVYSGRAIHKLNVQNSCNEYLLSSNNDKYWDTQSTFLEYFSYLCHCPIVIEFITHLFVCGVIVGSFILYISNGMLALVGFCMCVVLMLAISLLLWYRIFTSKLPSLSLNRSRRDRDENSFQMLGRQPLRSKRVKSTVTSNCNIERSSHPTLRQDSIDKNCSLSLMSGNSVSWSISDGDDLSIHDSTGIKDLPGKFGHKKAKKKRKRKKNRTQKDKFSRDVEIPLDQSDLSGWDESYLEPYGYNEVQDFAGSMTDVVNEDWELKSMTSSALKSVSFDDSKNLFYSNPHEWKLTGDSPSVHNEDNSQDGKTDMDILQNYDTTDWENTSNADNLSVIFEENAHMLHDIQDKDLEIERLQNELLQAKTTKRLKEEIVLRTKEKEKLNHVIEEKSAIISALRSQIRNNSSSQIDDNFQANNTNEVKSPMETEDDGFSRVEGSVKGLLNSSCDNHAKEIFVPAQLESEFSKSECSDEKIPENIRIAKKDLNIFHHGHSQVSHSSPMPQSESLNTYIDGGSRIDHGVIVNNEHETPHVNSIREELYNSYDNNKSQISASSLQQLSPEIEECNVSGTFRNDFDFKTLTDDDILNQLEQHYSTVADDDSIKSVISDSLEKDINKYSKILEDINENKLRSKYRKKPQFSEELNSFFSSMTEEERAKMILELASDTINEKIETGCGNDNQESATTSLKDFDTAPEDTSIVYAHANEHYNGLKSDETRIMQHSYKK